MSTVTKEPNMRNHQKMVVGKGTFAFDYKDSFVLENQQNQVTTKEEYEQLMKTTPIRQLYIQIFSARGPNEEEF